MGSKLRSSSSRKQRGFTLLEVMFATIIIVIGLVCILALMTAALGRMAGAQEELIGRQKCREALESIYAARNSSHIAFDQINNVVNGGIFVDGFQSLHRSGDDAIIGTADDATAPADYVETAGPDGILGTADDVQRPLSEFQRKIEIKPVLQPDGTINQDLRQIDVTITYRNMPTSSLRTYVTSAYISRYR